MTAKERQRPIQMYKAPMKRRRMLENGSLTMEMLGDIPCVPLLNICWKRGLDECVNCPQ